MDFTHYALKGIGNTAQVDVLYTDFTKAFDRVNHQILLNKLEEFEIPMNLLKWLGSYLTGRTMFLEMGKVYLGNLSLTPVYLKVAILVLRSSYSSLTISSKQLVTRFSSLYLRTT